MVVFKEPSDGAEQVYPAGTVAMIVESPVDASHAYRVRFCDGSELMAKRGDFVQLATVQLATAHGSGLEAKRLALEDNGLSQSVILRCIVGSRAYGLATDASDLDTRGVYLAPADRHWSLYGVPEQLENRVTDEVYWELQKFLTLALKANPNILEVLFSPLVQHATDLAQELVSMRASFLSKLVHQTYAGYATAQFRRFEARRARGQEPKWKHAMHLIRLLLAGIHVLETGQLRVTVDEAQRDRLMELRAGAMSFDQVDAWRLELLERFEAAHRLTRLPDRPDYVAVNAFLIRARRAAAEGKT